MTTIGYEDIDDIGLNISPITGDTTVSEVPGISSPKINLEISTYNPEGGDDSNSSVKLFKLANASDTTTVQAAIEWLKDGKLPIICANTTEGYTSKQGDYYFYPVIESNTTATTIIFQTISTSNDAWVLADGLVQRKRPIINIQLDGNGDVSSFTITTQTASRENTARNRIGTENEYNALGTYENGVIYNILPNP